MGSNLCPNGIIFVKHTVQKKCLIWGEVILHCISGGFLPLFFPFQGENFLLSYMILIKSEKYKNYFNPREHVIPSSVGMRHVAFFQTSIFDTIIP